MEYKEKAKTSNAMPRQSKGFKERRGEKQANQSKTKPVRGKENRP